MASWKLYIENHFSSCKHIASSHDHCRNRDVKIFLVPGEFTHVGVSDGTDAWIAPVAADPFSVNIRTVISSVIDGTFKAPAVKGKQNERKRLTVNLDLFNSTPQAAAPGHTERKRLHAGVDTALRGVRHKLHQA
jgi:hypothetical protein